MSSFVQFTKIDSIGNPSADRDLDEKELEAEQKAEKFSLHGFKRINPIPGRIGFYLRNFHKDVSIRNQTVISCIELIEGGSQRKFVRTLMNWWVHLDDYSKARVDIFDIFCDYYKINRARLWAVIQEGMYINNEAITRTALDGFRPKFIEVLCKMVQKEKNSADRKIMAEAIGLIGGEAPKIEDNRQIVNNTLNVSSDASSPIPSFADSIRRSDKNVRKSPALAEGVAPRELTEGNTDYIVDGYIVENDEEREMVLNRPDKNNFAEVEKQLQQIGKE